MDFKRNTQKLKCKLHNKNTPAKIEQRHLQGREIETKTVKIKKSKPIRKAKAILIKPKIIN